MSGQDQQYTPTPEEARGRYSDGAIHQGLTGDHLDAFDRLIAQVRRDAARDALDGYVAWAKSLNDKHPRFRAANDLAAAMAERFKTDNYSEVTS